MYSRIDPIPNFTIGIGISEYNTAVYGSARLIVLVFVINPPGSGREKKYWELLCVKSTRKHFGHAGCIIYDFKFGWKCFGRHGCDNISALELGSAGLSYGLVCIGSAQLG